MLLKWNTEDYPLVDTQFELKIQLSRNLGSTNRGLIKFSTRFQ